MTHEVTVNRKHKDRFFCFLFQDKVALLALYNAINGTSYENPDDLTINTLEDVLIMGMKNDISFLVGDTMNLYEHQSTYNPNMPLRGLFYIADLLRGYIATEKLDIYSGSMVKVPFPRYVVFYNGDMNRPDREILKLSDSYYPKSEGPALELICILLNINEGHNCELMEKCPRLREYARLISCIRENTGKGYQIEEAIRRAMDTCIAENVLAEFLRKHREESFHMLLRETDWALHEENEKKVWSEYGRAKEIIRMLEAYTKKKNVTLGEACDVLGYTLEEYDSAKEVIARIDR